jgi:hypothetical protein
MRINWIGQHSGRQVRSTKAEDLRLLNCYSEIVESRQAKTAVKVWGTPGLKLFVTLPGSGPARGLFTTATGRCFAAQGGALWELDAGGTASLRGTLLTSAGLVEMADNGLSLVLVDGPNGYTLALGTNTFAPWSDPDFPGARFIGFLDGRLVFPEPGTQHYWWTDVLTTDIDPLSFASAEGSPDVIVSQLMVHRELWLFGATTTEVHSPTGDPDTPFARNNAVFIEVGCAAEQSPAVVGETVCWLGANRQGEGMVFQAAGYTPQRISTHPLEEALAGMSSLSDAVGWGQHEQGHVYYWLSFPTGNQTWVFDATTGLWHARGYLNPQTGEVGRHRATAYTYAFHRHLVCDYANGRVYELDYQTYSDAGDALLREIIPPPLVDTENGQRVVQSRIELDMETGVGLDQGLIPGTDPQIRLQLSNDGGATWSSELPRSLGPIGKTRHKVEWHRLGSGFDRRLLLRMSDPVKFVVLNLWTE